MKLALLLFVFVLIGSINSIQGGRQQFDPTPNPDTGCWEGYIDMHELCERSIPAGMGRRGYGRASANECNIVCKKKNYASGECGPLEHCCCRPKQRSG